MNVSTVPVRGGVEKLVRDVAELAERIGELDLREAVELGQQADEAAQATTLAHYRRIEADADRAQRALERLSFEAHLHAGQILARLDGGAPGRGKKSERAHAIEEAGLDTRLARRLVELAQLDEDEIDDAREQLVEAGKRVTVRGVIAVATKRSAGTGEWYTPAEYVDAVAQVFGGPPDRDPASCLVAQALIGASRWWSAATPELGPDEIATGITEPMFAELLESHAGVGLIYHFETGEVIEPDPSLEPRKRAKAFAKAANSSGRLSHAGELAGKVYLNPEYGFPQPFVRAVLEGYFGRPLEAIWSAAAAELGRTEVELDADPERAAAWRAEALARATALGPVKEAIVLVNVATGTAAGQWLLAAQSAACFVAGRISFRDRLGEPQDGNRYEQVVFYLGEHRDRFLREFACFGICVAPGRRSTAPEQLALAVEGAA